MRVPPALLLLISSGLLLGWLQAWGADQGAERAAPWWIYLFLVLMSIAMVSLAAAVTIDPRPLVFRRALAGTALAWTVILASVIAAMRAATDVDRPIEIVVLAVLVAVAVSLVGLGMTTFTDESAGRPDWIARIGAAVAFAIAIVLSAGVVVGIASLGRAVWRSIAEGHGLDRLPWDLAVVVIVLPIVTDDRDSQVEAVASVEDEIPRGDPVAVGSFSGCQSQRCEPVLDIGRAHARGAQSAMAWPADLADVAPDGLDGPEASLRGRRAQTVSPLSPPSSPRCPRADADDIAGIAAELPPTTASDGPISSSSSSTAGRPVARPIRRCGRRGRESPKSGPLPRP